MMKMNFSIFKNAVSSAFLLLLFLCVGSSVSAQSSLSEAQSGIVPILKEYSGNFASKDAALTTLANELSTLNANTPNGGTAEATHAAKREFVLQAVSVLKSNGSVDQALITGYQHANVASSKMSVNVNTEAILDFYADLLSN